MKIPVCIRTKEVSGTLLRIAFNLTLLLESDASAAFVR
jgi:hypothetical protein